MLADPLKEWVLLDAVLINVTQYDAAPSAVKPCYAALPFLFDEFLAHHRFAERLLCSLSNMYVLVGMRRSERLTKPGEKKWADLVKRNGLRYLDDTGVLPLAVIVIRDEAETHVGIQWVESFLSGFNLGMHMIRCIERRLRKPCVPLTVEYSFGYWVKYFEQHLHCQSSRDINQLYNAELQTPLASLPGHMDLQVALDIANDTSQEAEEMNGVE